MESGKKRPKTSEVSGDVEKTTGFSLPTELTESNIREADWQALAKLYNSSSEGGSAVATMHPESPNKSTLRKIYFAPNDTTFAVRQNSSDTIVGVGTLANIDGLPVLCNLSVAPECRRQKVASQILMKRIDAAIERGIDEIFLTVRSPAASALCSKFGFSTVGYGSSISERARGHNRALSIKHNMPLLDYLRKSLKS